MKREFFQKLDKILDIASEHKQMLLQYPDVVMVGVGPERRKGKITGEPAIIVTVRKKRSSNELKKRGEKPLPQTIKGIPVDVIELGKAVEAPEIIAVQEKAKKTISKIRAKWLQTPNITAIGYGYKEKGGEIDFNTIAIQFFVKKKFPMAELQKQQISPIPEKINGVSTDVIQLSPIRPAAASGSRGDRHDPLKGGVAIGVGSKPFHYGTYGATVFDRTTGEQLFLSNQHVLDASSGTDTIQPSPVLLDDSVEVGFQLDVCLPIHFIRLDTPNTTVGTVLAGAAVAAAVAAALSDEIDPTRRGQEATMPATGSKTLFETQKVKMDYPELPIPGTPFKVKTAWDYERHTDAGIKTFSVSEEKKNPHVLRDKLLITDKKLYHPGDTIRIFGLILPEECAPASQSRDDRQPINPRELEDITHYPNVASSINLDLVASMDSDIASSPARRTNTRAAVINPKRCRCDRYHPVAILTPMTEDRAFPVVLREPVFAQKNQIFQDLLTVVKQRDDEKLLERVFVLVRYGCIYTGTLRVNSIPAGPWKHFFYVQTVNIATSDMKPLLAAQIIGGLPVSQNAKADLDIACGPLTWEDGEFDIELI
ncbi:TPA: hypothetical protein JAZ38_04255 [Legionella pneumophila]|nr:hypothetical protein [Legionella pneumophila]HAT7758842.1 hypothetical protein [Legionella pneumophila]HAU2064936.1 hypothetical protein [Legionella pneumophila]